MQKIMIYAYGNPGRQDDALGNAFVEEIKKWTETENIDYISFDSNYQLNIEDAYEIKDKDYVIFVDACVEEGVSNYSFEKLSEKHEVAFTTHAATPGYIFKLCKDMFNSDLQAFIMKIKGYEFALKEEMTDKAQENMNAALEFIKPLLKEAGILSVYK